MYPFKIKQHQLAQKNVYHSIDTLFSLQNEQLPLLGIKNVEQIPYDFVMDICKQGYQLHTLDHSSLGGRAIDLQLVNPVTGRFMSGSSSGTALNVFTYINDIGIGTDGGGSVLAPAISLQLFGFISPLLAQHKMQEYQRLSTDNIAFTPSLGYITRDFDTIERLIQQTMNLPTNINSIQVATIKGENIKYPFPHTPITCIDKYEERETIIPDLRKILHNCDVFLSYEGPIDVQGFGDSLFGHFDDTTKQIQKDAKKGYVRIANMVQASAICVPSSSFATAYVLLCESKEDKIKKMLTIAKQLTIPDDKMLEKYFSNLEMYFKSGFSIHGKTEIMEESLYEYIST